MKIQLSLLPLALLLPLAACSKSEAGGGDMAGKAKSAATEASAQMENIDFSKLAPAELKAKAQTVIADLGKQLESLKDVPAAKDLVAKYSPKLDQLAGMKDKLAGSLDAASIQKVIDSVTSKLSAHPDILAAVQPLLEKLKALV